MQHYQSRSGWKQALTKPIKIKQLNEQPRTISLFNTPLLQTSSLRVKLLSVCHCSSCVVCLVHVLCVYQSVYVHLIFYSYDRWSANTQMKNSPMTESKKSGLAADPLRSNVVSLGRIVQRPKGLKSRTVLNYLKLSYAGGAAVFGAALIIISSFLL